MSIAHNILAFLVLISILVTVHEYGHYWVAKRCGVKVLTFSIGFGKPLLSWMVGEVRWQIAALPLGGYVKMLDEREGEVDPAELHRAFNRQSLLKRALVVVAGPLANLLLAVLFYWVLMLGGRDIQIPRIGTVMHDSPAAMAGFQSGDTILALNGRPVTAWSDVVLGLLDEASAGQPADVAVRRAGGVGANLRLNLDQVTKGDIDASLPLRLGLDIAVTKPEFGEVLDGSVAQAAGLRVGDRLVSVDDRPVGEWAGFVDQVKSHAGQALHLQLVRNGSPVTVVLTPVAEKDAYGKLVGRIGAGPAIDEAAMKALERHLPLSPAQALASAFQQTYDTSVLSLKMMWRVVTGHVSVKQLSGPVGIAKMAGQSAALGWRPFVEMLCLVSISLGILNLLPIPVLDGGHLLYYSAELLRGRPLSERAMELGLRVGVGVLAALMIVAFYNDIARIVGG